MPEEARLEQTENGLVPADDGWFVVNARDAAWTTTETFGAWTAFEGKERFPELGIGNSIHAGMVVVADGTADAEERLGRVLTTDPGTGVMRHADAGYADAVEHARTHGLDLPGLEV